jgi:hypothetical protein
MGGLFHRQIPIYGEVSIIPKHVLIYEEGSSALQTLTSFMLFAKSVSKNAPLHFVVFA